MWVILPEAGSCSGDVIVDRWCHLDPMGCSRGCWSDVSVVLWCRRLSYWQEKGEMGWAGRRVSFETSFDSKQPKLEPKLVSALSETKRLFRLFRRNREFRCFDWTETNRRPTETEYNRIEIEYFIFHVQQQWLIMQQNQLEYIWELLLTYKGPTCSGYDDLRICQYGLQCAGGGRMAAGIWPNGHVYHQDPLRIESQLQNTQTGVGSLL